MLMAGGVKPVFCLNRQPISLLIELTGDLGIFEKSERKRLGEALCLRNDCGHPVKYRPGEKKVSSFIEDLLQAVFGAAD